ncbi:DNA-processing protein DprA [candidate division KSB1 bacterium]
MNSITAMLQLLQARGIGFKTFEKIICKIDEIDVSLSEVLSFNKSDIMNILDLDKEIVNSIIEAEELAKELSEELTRHSIYMLLKNRSDYPARLKNVLGSKDAPPVLFAQGNLNLLNIKSVGMCGARKPTEQGLKIAGESASILAENNINIVSGYAPGVDMAAHTAALKSGGASTFVLAEGILQFKIKKEVIDYLTDDNYLVISEFLPKLNWNAINSMQRNKTICGLSDAMILIESGLEGGTFAAGKTALAFNCPLFAVEYSPPIDSARGNQYFLENGAIALKNDISGKPDLKEIIKVINARIESGLQTGSQYSLFSG